MTLIQRYLLGVSFLSLSAYAYGPAQAQTAVGEIVIEATGREANLQDVPAAVTAIDAFTLENAGVTDLGELESCAYREDRTDTRWRAK